MPEPFFHEEVPAVVRLAQVVGITTSATLAGLQFGLSFFTVPALMKSPAHLLARQWAHIYNLGARSAAPLTLVPLSIFSYLAYRAHRNTGNASLYIAAALLAPSIIPYTIFVMSDTNDALYKKANEASEQSKEVQVRRDDSTHQLVDRWASLNVVRGMLTLASAMVGAWASLGAVEVVGVAAFEFVTGANRMG